MSFVAGAVAGALPPHPQDLALDASPDRGSLQENEKGMPKHPLYRSVEATESALGLLPSMALSSAQLGLILLRLRKETHVRDGS